MALWEAYHDKGPGFEILAFPCNQFGLQEPGTNEQIVQYASGYNVQFKMMDKIYVNGSNTHPLFAFLKLRLKGQFGDFIKWNYTKFLCDMQGRPYRRYGPKDAPFSFEDDLRVLLGVDVVTPRAKAPAK